MPAYVGLSVASTTSCVAIFGLSCVVYSLVVVPPDHPHNYVLIFKSDLPSVGSTLLFASVFHELFPVLLEIPLCRFYQLYEPLKLVWRFSESLL